MHQIFKVMKWVGEYRKNKDKKLEPIQRPTNIQRFDSRRKHAKKEGGRKSGKRQGAGR